MKSKSKSGSSSSSSSSCSSSPPKASLDLLKTLAIGSSCKITIPENVYSIIVEAWGPGGGGATGLFASAEMAMSVIGGGGGGGAGGYLKATIPVKPGDVYSLTIPAGGAGGVGTGFTAGQNGSAGGNGIPTSLLGPGQNWTAGAGGGGSILLSSPIIPTNISAVGGAGGIATFNKGGIGGFASKGQRGSDIIVSGGGIILQSRLSSSADGGDATAGGSGGVGTNLTFDIAAEQGSLPGGGGGGGNLFSIIAREFNAATFNGASGANGLIVITYSSPHLLSFIE